MSNHSHLHKNKAGQDEDAFGTREECNVCREAAGLPPMEDVRERMAARVSEMKGGTEPAEQLLADLEAQEAENDTLRRDVRELTRVNVAAQTRIGELETMLREARAAASADKTASKK